MFTLGVSGCLYLVVTIKASHLETGTLFTRGGVQTGASFVTALFLASMGATQGWYENKAVRVSESRQSCWHSLGLGFRRVVMEHTLT